MKKFQIAALLLSAILLMGLAFGCSGAKDAEKETGDAAGTMEKGVEDTGNDDNGNPAVPFKGAIDEAKEVAAPMVKIVMPAVNSTMTGSKVNVQVAVENFNLVDKLGKANAAGEGHIHYIIDSGAPTPSFNNMIDLDVAPGTHSLKAELHNNDHTPLSPAVETSVQFTVE